RGSLLCATLTASSVDELAISSNTTTASACSFHRDDILELRFNSSSSVLMRAEIDTMRINVRATSARRLFSSRNAAPYASASATVNVRLKKRMGTTWRYFGSATRTNTRMDSSTRRSSLSSAESCCALTTGGWNTGAAAGAFAAAEQSKLRRVEESIRVF